MYICINYYQLSWKWNTRKNQLLLKELCIAKMKWSEVLPVYLYLFIFRLSKVSSQNLEVINLDSWPWASSLTGFPQVCLTWEFPVFEYIQYWTTETLHLNVCGCNFTVHSFPWIKFAKIVKSNRENLRSTSQFCRLQQSGRRALRPEATKLLSR